MAWYPKKKGNPKPPSDLDSGFSTTTEPAWSFDATLLSPLQCSFVRTFANSGNQEPCSEEVAVQQLALELAGKSARSVDTYKLALEARIGTSGHTHPWSRDEVAGFVSEAIIGMRRLTRKRLARDGYTVARWKGDDLGTVPEVPWPPPAGQFKYATKEESRGAS